MNFSLTTIFLFFLLLLFLVLHSCILSFLFLDNEISSEMVSKIVGRVLQCSARTHSGGSGYDTLSYLLNTNVVTADAKDSLNVIVRTKMYFLNFEKSIYIIVCTIY